MKKFDHEFPARFADELLSYLSLSNNEFPEASRMFEQPMMNLEYFNRLTDQFRSPHLWYWKDGEWKLRHNLPGG